MDPIQKNLQNIANFLRKDSLIMTTKAGSGHATSCLSCAEIMSSLFFSEIKYDVSNADNPDNDEFVLSKGHAAPILYSCLHHAGCAKYPLEGLRKFNSPLEGHPTPFTRWIKVATGSLGQGLSIASGMALAMKFQKRKSRVFVLLGDSELAEGSNWEAIQLASYYNLNNLVALVDMNGLGQRGETMLGHNTKLLAIRFSSFGWNSITIDGHNVKQILSSFEKASKSEKPTVIIARTIKGKGVSFLENKDGWHGKPLDEKELEKALKQINSQEKFPDFKIKKPEIADSKQDKEKQMNPLPWKIKDSFSTREAYGKALANLANKNPSVLALDAEVSNSTFAEEVKKVRPKQFIECFIAEQNMIGMTLGLSKKGYAVFASTFSSFLSRTHDQLRMAALSKPNFTVCGSHCGISIGEDGPSQMGLEDIGMFRSLQGSIIFYPSDAMSTEKIVYLCNKLQGLKYIRTTRPKLPIIYNKNEKFELGDFKVLKESSKDKLTIIGAGITTHESLKAYSELKKQQIDAAVIDLYCIKPLDIKKLSQFIKSHGNKMIISEDHYKETGIGEMLISELENSGIIIKHLCIREIPHSGKSEELLEKYGISAKHIIAEARKIAN